MLFLVVSRPAPSKITKELIQARLAFRDWIRQLKKKIKCFYPRKGRGAVVIFEVASKKDLNGLLREWRGRVHAGVRRLSFAGPEKGRGGAAGIIAATTGSRP